jgi:hypothetical protein
MLTQSILKAILGTSTNTIEITKAPNWGFVIQSIDTVESGMCQYQTWETTQIDLYVDKNGNIIDGDYGIETISQPTCEELESSYQYEFGSESFNNRLERNYNESKDKKELNQLLQELLTTLDYMNIHDKISFDYSFYKDEVSNLNLKMAVTPL